MAVSGAASSHGLAMRRIKAWHGRFLLVPFSYASKKMNDLLGIFFRSSKIFINLPPVIEGLNQNCPINWKYGYHP